MNSLLTEALKSSTDPSDCRRTIAALQAIGFDDHAFSKLHHMNHSIAVFQGYSKGRHRYREGGSNHRVHQRAVYELLSCPEGIPPKGKSFQGLAEEAFKLIPPVAG